MQVADGSIFSRGTSTSRDEAYAKALGEVFERTSLRFIGEAEVFSHSIAEMKKENKYAFTERKAQPTKKQKEIFPDFDIKDDDIFSFIEVSDLVRGGKKMIPAQCIFTSGDSFPKEKKFIQSSTQGAAGSYSRKSVLRSGLSEEDRHYFLESWYFKNLQIK